jgi:hypothetical protein
MDWTAQKEKQRLSWRCENWCKFVCDYVARLLCHVLLGTRFYFGLKLAKNNRSATTDPALSGITTAECHKLNNLWILCLSKQINGGEPHVLCIHVVANLLYVGYQTKRTKKTRSNNEINKL